MANLLRYIYLVLLVITSSNAAYGEEKRYSVDLLVLGPDVYEADYGRLIIRTMGCTETPVIEKVILIVTGRTFPAGKLLFRNGATCDVKAVYAMALL